MSITIVHRPFCVIDAVFCIRVKYEGVQAVLRADRNGLPLMDAQESLSSLCAHIVDMGPERMSVEVFGNRQRTSARSGFLKAEAVGRFAGSCALMASTISRTS